MRRRGVRQRDRNPCLKRTGCLDARLRESMDPFVRKLCVCLHLQLGTGYAYTPPTAMPVPGKCRAAAGAAWHCGRLHCQTTTLMVD
jgi:hypothetical protein